MNGLDPMSAELLEPSRSFLLRTHASQQCCIEADKLPTRGSEGPRAPVASRNNGFEFPSSDPEVTMTCTDVLCSPIAPQNTVRGRGDLECLTLSLSRSAPAH